MRSNDVIANQKHQGESPTRWSWTGFACGSVFFGVLVFFNVTMPFAGRFWPHVTETIIVAAICGLLIGRFGDVAFAKILSLFRWF